MSKNHYDEKNIYNNQYCCGFYCKSTSGNQYHNPNLSSMLDIVSSDKGVLFPQYELVSLTNNTSPVNNPVKGSIIYNKEQEYLIILKVIFTGQAVPGKGCL